MDDEYFKQMFEREALKKILMEMIESKEEIDEDFFLDFAFIAFKFGVQTGAYLYQDLGTEEQKNSNSPKSH